ncbi:MAG: helix-turn-helix domain-containing protein [Verrucomicrobia bacterium]|jgi:transcriptional regulator with XRE-family HTH domain|nr:helix-turn-helix domain-containing protein [Verrucomicrobiota bacterium]
MNFGQLIKELRIAKELTLRQCCAELGVDPSNWSKMERGVTPPPKDTALLERWAGFFGLTGEQRQEFLDLAFLARQEIPPDMASDEKVIAALPAFFRAVRGQELEGDRLKQFIEDLRAVHSPDQRPAS